MLKNKVHHVEQHYCIIEMQCKSVIKALFAQHTHKRVLLCNKTNAILECTFAYLTMFYLYVGTHLQDRIYG